MNNIFEIIDKLEKSHSLSLSEYEYLISNRTPEAANYLMQKAVSVRKSIYDNFIYIRGLIEISNICKNDCYYCGIRKSNLSCDRYRISKEEILKCCENGYNLGFRTFVLQGGEDLYFSDEIMCDIVNSIHTKFPDCAITLSLGERTKESYQKLYESGATRYLLRHETADKEHYEKATLEELLPKGFGPSNLA